jgi:hypothetical protein
VVGASVCRKISHVTRLLHRCVNKFASITEASTAILLLARWTLTLLQRHPMVAPD